MNKEEWIDGYEPLYEKERNEGMQKALDTLTPREQEALKYRYYDNLLYREMEKKLRITRERVSQIVRKALRKLRNRKRLKILADSGWEEVEMAIKVLEKEHNKERTPWK